MPVKEIQANFRGVRIRARNTWTSGATLLINDVVVDRNSSIFALDKETPFLSAEIEVEGSKTLVEVYIYAMLTIKMNICVNRKLISGDRF